MASALGITFIVLFAYIMLYEVNQSVDKELVNAHIRSLLHTNNIIDISSSDPNTIKPWFMGKLGFGVKTEDLTNEGFPLIGGRLDYLHDHEAASLVYKRRQHLINLFIYPIDSDKSSTIKQSDYRGYNIIDWNKNGLKFCAISDLDMPELKKFAIAFINDD